MTKLLPKSCVTKMKHKSLSHTTIFVEGQTTYHMKANGLNYLYKVFWYLILPFSFKASNSERPSLLQKLLPLHFIAKITALCCILVTDECTPKTCEEFLIC